MTTVRTELRAEIIRLRDDSIAQETENLELRRLVAILVNLLDPYGERARTTEGDIIQVTIDAARNALKEGKR